MKSKILAFLGCGTELYLANIVKQKTMKNMTKVCLFSSFEAPIVPLLKTSRAFYSHLSARKKTLESLYIPGWCFWGWHLIKETLQNRRKMVRSSSVTTIFLVGNQFSLNKHEKICLSIHSFREMKTREIKRELSLLLYLNDTCLVKPPATFSSSACCR